jgi:FkbM family methyltransferase
MFNHYQLHRIFDISLRNTNKIKGKDTYCVTIGANNGTDDDTLSGYIMSFDWKGLLIEPLPEHVNELKVNYNRQIKQGKIVVAEECISDKEEYVEFGYIPHETIKQNNLHPAMKGMSCVLPAQNGFGNDPESIKIFEQYKQTTRFYTKTIDTICKEYYIDNIDYVQCDVEGYDLKALSKFNFIKYKPKIVKFESRNISSELDKANDLFEQYNYSVFQLGGDCLAVNNEHLEHLKKNNRWREVLMLNNATTDNVPAFFDQDIDSNSYITEI